MYSYKHKIDCYQENRMFLAHSYSSKNDFLKQYNKLYNDKEKSKQLYLQILCDLKVAVCDGNINNFKKISKILNYVVDFENEEFFNKCFHEDIYPLKNTNFIILACQYNQLEILKHIFSNYSSLYERLHKNENRKISPNDQDENYHDAFYYSIKTGNTELLETLISKWLGNYFESHSTELDEILSKAYEELKLKNVLLSKSMEFFVEEKLINLRFFSNSSNKSQNNKISLDNINKRIELLIEQIKELNSIDEVNEEFLLVLKYVAMNIFVLKRQLKVSYDTLPWEEIEFISVSFISCSTTDKEINIFYRVILNKVKILKHLTNFAKRLAAVQNIIKTCKISFLLELPNISRGQGVAQIIEKYPEFQELYQDYHRIRDIHTLNVINDYVTLVSSIDVNSKEGQLAIIRSLQAIGECLKNTFESPKLSAHTSNLLFLSLHKSTRQLVVTLRNSLSHSYSLTKRMEILENEQVAFFDGIKNDIKKIGFIVKNIFYENNLRTLKSICESIVSCKDTGSLKQIVSLVNSFNTKSSIKLFRLEKNQLTEHEKFKDIIMKLKNIIPDQTESEKKILEEMEYLISSQNIQRSNTLEDCTALLLYLRRLKLDTHTLSMDNNCLNAQKGFWRTFLNNLNSSTVLPRDLKSLDELSSILLNSCHLKENCNEITRLIMKIFCIIDIQLSDIHWVSKLREKLMERTCYNDQCDSIQNFANPKDKPKNLLTLKLLELKKIITVYNLCKSSDNTTFANSQQVLLAALEMLMLEILSILGDALNRLEDNSLFVDDNIPLLIGKNLRNHLAHGNAILDIMPSNYLLSVIVTAQKFVKELDKNGNNIGKSELEDLKNLKNKIDRAKNIISLKQKMFNAVESGDFESLKSCIAQGADIHSRMNDMQTSLHAAAKGGNLEMVKFLIDQKVNVQVKSVDGKNPLHIAAEYGNVSVADFFLNQKYFDVDYKDEWAKTPLHLAALCNRKVIVETLLKNGANCSAKDRLGFSPLHYAIQENHKNVAQILLKKEKYVDANEAEGGRTSLYLASERGYSELVKFLLDRGANVHAKTEKKAVPLHLASLNGHTEVVNLLVAKKSNPNARDLEGYTPLICAIKHGHKIIADILLNNGADPNIPDKSYSSTPLHYAAEYGYLDMVEALIYYKANINAVDLDNKTPLFYAIVKGHLEIVKIICQHENAIKNVQFSLHLAIVCGHVKIVDYLIRLNVDINSTDDNGNTSLHLAALKGQQNIVVLLIKNKAKINLKNKEGLTPLLFAFVLNRDSINEINIPMRFRNMLDVENKFFTGDKSMRFGTACTNKEKDKIVDILLQNGADINVTTRGGSTILHLAATSGNCAIVELLIRRKFPVNSKCYLGNTPLEKAVMFGCKEIVNCLIKNGADVNVMDKKSLTALHWACINGTCDIVKILLNNNADVNASGKNNLTPLFFAVKENHTDVVETLLAHKSKIVNVNKIDLVSALENNNNDILKMLLSYSPVAKHAIETDFEGVSLLHISMIKKCNKDIIRTLITNGADINSSGKGNISPLFIAVDLKKEKLIKFLLENGADVNYKASDGSTVLHIAAKDGNSEIMAILLQYGIDVNAKDNNNRTALELAVADGNLPIVKMLLPRFEININNKGNNDFTMLHIAAQWNNHLEVIKYLVANGADIHSRNDAGLKPMHLAASEGQEETVKYFLSLGQHIEESGAGNHTPLHYCAMYSRVNLARYLINKGANVNASSLANRTPLHTAVENRATLEFIELLLEHGAMYNTVDVFGLKPLSLSKDTVTTNFLSAIDKLWQAVKQNNIMEVKRYINKGAFVNVRNSDNVTPLHFAAWKGYDDIVTELIKNKDIANVVGKKGLTPLHYAAKFGHFNVCKTLLAAGAIYDIRGDNGKTPIDLCENQDVSGLLRLIQSCFEMVSNKNTKLVGTIKKMKDETVVKALMNACNTDRKSLIAAAILNDFPKVDELKQVWQNDLSSKIKMAEAMVMFERYDEALKIYELALKKRTELLGKNNPSTLDMQENIAMVLYEQQKYQEALDMLQNIYEKRKDTLNENSKEALCTRSNIASVLYRQGKNEEALVILQQVYKEQKNILAMNDPRFLSTHQRMGSVLISLGKFDEALIINTKVFEQQKNSFGSEHPNTLSAQNNLALALLSQNKCEQAEEIYRAVYESRKKILGPTHSDTLRAFHNIVTVLSQQKKYDEALKAYEEVLKIQKSCLGFDHFDTLNTQLNMGRLLYHQGKYISAFKIFNTYLPEFKNKVGPSHKEVQVCETLMESLKKGLKYSGRSGLINIINNLNKEARAIVSSGDLERVQHMLESDIDLNETDEDGRTLLHFAANNGNVDIARALLNSGCILTNVTKKGNTPLHTAASKGHKEIVEEFLEYVNRAELPDFINAKTTVSGTAALHVAAKGGNYEIVQLLLKYGALYCLKNNDGKTPLTLSQNQKVVHLLKFVDMCFNDVTKGNAEVIDKLREMGKDEFLAVVNARNDQHMSLMQVAIVHKHRQISKDLLTAMKKAT